jgi:hypothetical protein
MAPKGAIFLGLTHVNLITIRHCEERLRRSNPAFFAVLAKLDCFAEPVIGRRFAPTRWLAMTVFPQSHAGAKPGFTQR